MSVHATQDPFEAQIRDLIEVAEKLGRLAHKLSQLTHAKRNLRDVPDEDTGLPEAANTGELQLTADQNELQLTANQKLICERILNVFETGSIGGNYAAIAIFHDGPHQIRQITYGRSQTTEYGNLRELVQMYVAAQGVFSNQLRPFADNIGRTALVDDSTFKTLLRRAGTEDPVMRDTQDTFFDRRYFQPAMQWAGKNGFTMGLSALVIYDSFIHSGSIRDFLRSRFAELPPARGGNEKTWITQYVDVRNRWLANHSNHDVRPSVYRTKDLLREIAMGNWDLSSLPIMAHGVPVDDRSPDGGNVASMTAQLQPDDIPFLGDVDVAAPHLMPDDGAEIWGDDYIEVGAAAAEADLPALATLILQNPRIALASSHSSGISDLANARQNVIDTANGQRARRSSYGQAPGGAVALNRRLLSGLLGLAEHYSFAVSEIAGGSHSPHSRHYAGVASDINVINGRHIDASHPDLSAFKAACTALGVTELRGPGDPHHGTHVHAGWPRPV